MEKFTIREYEIANHLKNNPTCTSREVATYFMVEVHTVNAHLQNMYRKLGLSGAGSKRKLIKTLRKSCLEQRETHMKENV